MNKNVEAFFIDIDGTLVKGHKNIEISLKDKHAIKNAAKEGKYIILSTGRSIEEVKHIWKQINLNIKETSYVIVNNGSAIWNLNSNKMLFEAFIQEKEFKEIFNYVEKNGYAIKNSLEKNFYVKKNLLSKVISKTKIGINIEHDFSKVKYNNKTAKKLGIITSLRKSKVQKIVDELRKLFPHIEIVVSGPGLYIEINKFGITKGTAAKFLSDKLKFDINNSAHIGDSMNDAAGFEVCGVGVVMSNGMKELKSKADFSTKSVRKSGVSLAIKSLSIK
ncbi:MAG: Cof-type HAD-IIB family hydrolase [Mycoplasmataceae bacterium]|nr:Cof-type HAD-IIB family hydrolase [Mycoplasmataceae bacterium]